ncbi:hypothetical protein HDU91_002909, partial [Kappamyces sp. JEL0680]
LETLVAMGFNNQSANLAALEKSKGSIERAVEIIVANTAAGSPSVASPKIVEPEPTYQIQLKMMGFNNPETNSRAYSQANGNMEQAVSLWKQNLPNTSNTSNRNSNTSNRNSNTSGSSNTSSSNNTSNSNNSIRNNTSNSNNSIRNSSK